MEAHLFAERLYRAYGDSAGWKNFRGDPMPTWEELPENIRINWMAVAVDAINALI